MSQSRSTIDNHGAPLARRTDQEASPWVSQPFQYVMQKNLFRLLAETAVVYIAFSLERVYRFYYVRPTDLVSMYGTQVFPFTESHKIGSTVGKNLLAEFSSVLQFFHSHGKNHLGTIIDGLTDFNCVKESVQVLKRIAKFV